MQTDLTKKFIKMLDSREHGKSTSQKFQDFCELAYCAYAKPMAAPEHQEALEARYMAIVGTYRDKDAIRAYPELVGLVSKGIEAGDFLGVIAAEVNALDGKQGQFFTPYEVSRLMAEMTFGDKDTQIEDRGYLTVDEPACGSGGMILAFAETMHRRGYNPARQLFVRATDISSLCYWMSYLQLTLAGIPAQVIRGNSLTLETFETAWTRPAVRFLNYYGDIFETRKESKPDTPMPVLMTDSGQLALF